MGKDFAFEKIRIIYFSFLARAFRVLRNLHQYHEDIFPYRILEAMTVFGTFGTLSCLQLIIVYDVS